MVASPFQMGSTVIFAKSAPVLGAELGPITISNKVLQGSEGGKQSADNIVFLDGDKSPLPIVRPST